MSALPAARRACVQMWLLLPKKGRSCGCPDLRALLFGVYLGAPEAHLDDELLSKPGHPGRWPPKRGVAKVVQKRLVPWNGRSKPQNPSRGGVRVRHYAWAGAHRLCQERCVFGAFGDCYGMAGLRARSLAGKGRGGLSQKPVLKLQRESF